MQPVASSNNPNQLASPVRANSKEQKQTLANTPATAEQVTPAHFTGDIVNLSIDSIAQSSINIIPSTPVSNEEKAALLGSSSGRTSFSIYA